MRLFNKNTRHSCQLFFTRCLLPVAFCLLSIAATAQEPSVQTSADKKNILIGEQVTVTVKASYQPGLYNIHWFKLPDSIPHFEVVNPGKVDSITSADNS